MAATYRIFPVYVLSDLAVRDARESDRITFNGNHLSHQIVLPGRADNETAEAYAVRCKEFRSRLARRWDLSRRLALAHEYYVRQGWSTWKAAHLVFTEALPEARRFAAAERVEYAKLGIPCRPVKPSIGTSRRGHRTKRKRPGFSRRDRRIETIRTLASRFKQKCASFDRLYTSTFGAWRSDHCRDAEWYAEAEPDYRAWVTQFEQHEGPFYWVTAMPLLSTALLYHEQKKHAHAEDYYRRAIRAARQAIMAEAFRNFVIEWVRIELKLCTRRTAMVRIPFYAGPWVESLIEPLQNIQILQEGERLKQLVREPK